MIEKKSKQLKGLFNQTEKTPDNSQDKKEVKQKMPSYTIEGNVTYDEQPQVLERIVNIAKTLYGSSGDELTKLAQELEKQAASQKSLDIEEYRSRLTDMKDADSWRKQQREQEEKETARRNLIGQWQRDARELKLIVPQFDLRQALKNSVFANVLSEGGSVAEAFVEMMRMPKNPQREMIPQNAQTARRGTGEASFNPSQMSSEDFKRYIDRIKEQ